MGRGIVGRAMQHGCFQCGKKGHQAIDCSSQCQTPTIAQEAPKKVKAMFKGREGALRGVEIIEFTPSSSDGKGPPITGPPVDQDNDSTDDNLSVPNILVRSK